MRLHSKNRLQVPALLQPVNGFPQVGGAAGKVEPGRRSPRSAYGGKHPDYRGEQFGIKPRSDLNGGLTYPDEQSCVALFPASRAAHRCLQPHRRHTACLVGLLLASLPAQTAPSPAWFYAVGGAPLTHALPARSVVRNSGRPFLPFFLLLSPGHHKPSPIHTSGRLSFSSGSKPGGYSLTPAHIPCRRNRGTNLTGPEYLPGPMPATGRDRPPELLGQLSLVPVGTKEVVVEVGDGSR